MGYHSLIDTLVVTVTVPPAPILAAKLRAAEAGLRAAEASLGIANAIGTMEQSNSAYRAYLVAWDAWLPLHNDHCDIAITIATEQKKSTWAITEAQEWPAVQRKILAFLTRVSASDGTSSPK